MGRPKKNADINAQTPATESDEGETASNTKAKRAPQERGALFLVSVVTDENGAEVFTKECELSDARDAKSWLQENGDGGKVYTTARIYPKRFAVKTTTKTALEEV